MSYDFALQNYYFFLIYAKKSPRRAIFLVQSSEYRVQSSESLAIYFFELRMMSFRTQVMDCKTTAGQIMVKEG